MSELDNVLPLATLKWGEHEQEEWTTFAARDQRRADVENIVKWLRGRAVYHPILSSRIAWEYAAHALERMLNEERKL